MFSWLARWRKRFKEVVILQGVPYLYRYRLWSSKTLGVYLHKIVRSDTDRNLHDHPFAFTSIILWGGYWEHGAEKRDFFDASAPPHGRRVTETVPVRRWYGLGSVIHHTAEDLHRIELSRPTWTLFIRGRRVRVWGFQTPDGWVPWDEYEKLGEYASKQQYQATDPT